MARPYPTTYSIVGHVYLEQLCGVEVRRARTKDLVWLVYRHTLGRSEGYDTGRGWKATGSDLAAALGIQRANAQRCRAEALELGLISAGPSGELYVGTVRTIHRIPVIRLDPVGSILDPYGSRKDPLGSTLDPVGSRKDPVGSKKRSVRTPNKERIKKEEEEGRSVDQDPKGSAFDRLLFLISEGTASRGDIDAELFRLVELEESSDDDIRIEARNMRAHLLNTLERHR